MRLRKFILLFLCCLLLGSAFSQDVTGDREVVEYSTHTYTLDTALYSSASTSTTAIGSWNVEDSLGTGGNAIILSQNAVPANGAITVTVQFSKRATSFFHRIEFELFTSDTTSVYYYLDVYARTLPDALSECLSVTPLSQEWKYPTQVLTDIGLTSCTLNTLYTYSLSYQWEYSFQLGNTAIGPSPARHSYTWSELGGSTGTLISPTANGEGTTLYGCRIVITYDGKADTIYSPIAIVVQVPFTAGEIFHNSVYAQVAGPDGVVVGVSSGTTVAQVGQTPATGVQCPDKTYTWEVSYNHGPWQFLASGEALPAANHPVITTDTRIRRGVTCGAILNEEEGDLILYSNILSYNIAYTSAYLENRNYIRVNNILKPGLATWQQADQLATGDKVQATAYFDGFERNEQLVQKETSLHEQNGTWNDFVTHIEYDGAGRAPRSFLPYPAPTAPLAGGFKDSAAYRQPATLRAYYGEPATAPTWSVTAFEKSPLSRPVSSKLPGADIGANPQNPGVRAAYGFNPDTLNTTEKIVIWQADITSGLPVAAGYYAPGMLSRQEGRDERGQRLITYNDVNGRAILKRVELKNGSAFTDYSGWLSTYNVYDVFGRLRFTLTPKAVRYMAAANWAVTTQQIDALCYYFQYDAEGRLAVKHSPGTGELHYVYDRRNRPVLTQDEYLRNLQQWNYCIYDAYDRPVITGLLDYAAGRQTMQQLIDQQWDDCESTGNLAQVLTIPVTTKLFSGSINIETYNPLAGNQYSTALTANFGKPGNVVNTISVYDQAVNDGVHDFNGSYSLTTDAVIPRQLPYADTSVLTFRTKGFATAGYARVIDTATDNNDPTDDVLLFASTYYDERGRVFQAQAENLPGGNDVQFLRYDFNGRPDGYRVKRNIPGLDSNRYAQFDQKGYTVYDRLGRPLKLYRAYGDDNDYKYLAQYVYDAFGRLKQKLLSPAYNARPLEQLDYTYNLLGWLTGINKEYTNGATDQWSRYFGLALDYSNKDQISNTSPTYNGQLNSSTWRTQGENMLSRFDYAYDNAGRFLKANYRQVRPGASQWSNDDADFTVDNITYDENGNLETLRRKSLGYNSPVVTIDNLSYIYESLSPGSAQTSNRLLRVNDAVTTNYQTGDFIKGSDTTGPDYTYDAGGNLLTDDNRGFTATSGGLEWNYLGKVQAIHKAGVSLTRFTYDALGNKLEKIVYKTIGGSHTTHYLGDMIFETDSSGSSHLSCILHEEGRLRIVQPQNTFGQQIPSVEISGAHKMPGGKHGVFDYFVKDQQGNTRVVLTEEVHRELHVCTMETTGNPGTQQYEETTFGAVDNGGQPAPGNEVQNTRTAVPREWDCNDSQEASKLVVMDQQDAVVGPNLLLKVMAGDEVNAQTKYYFDRSIPSPQADALNPVSTMLLNLLMGAPGVGSPLRENPGSVVAGTLHPGGALLNFLDEPAADPGMPKAGLYVVFLDERFRFVSAQFQQVAHEGSQCEPLVLTGLRAPQNGYAIVFVSNQQRNITLFYDDLMVNHERGRLLQEDSYYPDGLKMTAICARALSKLPNRYGYQGNFSEEDEESGYNEFALRMYDPQLGRWISADPYDEYASPYIGMGNDPVNNVDPNGGCILCAVNTFSNFLGFGNIFDLESRIIPGAEVQTTVPSFFAKVKKVIKEFFIEASKVHAIAGVQPRTPHEIIVKLLGSEQAASYFRSNIPADLEIPDPGTIKPGPKKNLMEKWADYNKALTVVSEAYPVLGVNIRGSVGVYNTADGVVVMGSSLVVGHTNGVDLQGHRLSGMGYTERMDKTMGGLVTVTTFAFTPAVRAADAAAAEAVAEVRAAAEGGVESLGAGRTAVKQWLQSAGNLEQETLIQNIESAGFKRVSPITSPVSVFERGGMRIRLDPPQSGTPFNHMHLEYGGKSYNIFLDPVNYKSPAAHIPIR